MLNSFTANPGARERGKAEARRFLFLLLCQKLARAEKVGSPRSRDYFSISPSLPLLDFGCFVIDAHEERPSIISVGEKLLLFFFYLLCNRERRASILPTSHLAFRGLSFFSALIRQLLHSA